MSGTTATHGGAHALAFRVMRLCRPTFQVDTTPLRFDPCDLLAGEDLFDDPIAAAHLPGLLLDKSNSSFFFARRRRMVETTSEAATSDLTYRTRLLLHNPSDALGLSSLLVLPQIPIIPVIRGNIFGHLAISNRWLDFDLFDSQFRVLTGNGSVIFQQQASSSWGLFGRKRKDMSGREWEEIN